jgi:5-hydroxyisourate hydrolase
MKFPILLATAAIVFTPALAGAAEISTHVLDLARGVGGKDVPVVLLKKAADGNWSVMGKVRTDENGRVRNFAEGKSYDIGTYKLQFDMSAYPTAQAAPFFPEIDLVFQVSDAKAHYHVPVVVSPFGYSTYRGN